MGLFDSIKNEAQRNFIARPPDQANTIVYKWPDQNIRMMTQLTVRADEVCIFVKNGAVVGVLPAKAEMYSLDSHNIPFISRLLEGVTGGNMFLAELFFVLNREIPNLRFGAPVGMLQDPKLKLAVTPLVHGEFSLSVRDPQKLVVGIAGMTAGGQDDVFLHWFTEQLKKIIREELASMVVKKGMTLFDMTSGAYNSDIEAVVLTKVQAALAPYGVQVNQLGSIEVALNDADTEKLSKYTETQAYADLGTNPGLQGYAQAKMMMGAGEGFAKGGEGSGNALGGMGMGMGMAMANMFSQNQQNQNQQRGNAPVQGQAPGGPQGGGNLVACGKCGNQVPPGKFCAGCGSPLAAAGPRHCSECGGELGAGAKFCGSCGKPQA